MTWRLWVSVALLTLPGWRVPGVQAVTSEGVLCPYDHGLKEVYYRQSAKCGGCRNGWFQWATCPLGDALIASDDGTAWQCHASPTHNLKARMCPDGQFVGLLREDGWWQCTSRDGHLFEAAGNRCIGCKFGIPVRHAGGAQWICPACGLTEFLHGG